MKKTNIRINSDLGEGKGVEKEISEIRNEKGIFNLQLLFYMVGIYKEIKAKFIKSGIINTIMNPFRSKKLYAPHEKLYSRLYLLLIKQM